MTLANSRGAVPPLPMPPSEPPLTPFDSWPDTLDVLLAQRAELDRQIEIAKGGVIAELRERIAAFGITLEDIEGRKRKPRSDKGGKRGARKGDGRAA